MWPRGLARVPPGHGGARRGSGGAELMSRPVWLAERLSVCLGSALGRGVVRLRGPLAAGPLAAGDPGCEVSLGGREMKVTGGRFRE